MTAAPASGEGKTILTCALLTALSRRGLSPCAFKCGPDYIDPMYHRAVPGVESRNLDLFLMGADRARLLYAYAVEGHRAAVCEASMGYYDGLGGTTDANSAWRTADALGLPVLLTVSARRAALSLGAVLRGMRDFRENSHIAAVVLNGCSPALCRSLAPVLEAEAGIPVLGCLPQLPEASLESRHLGLYAAGEVENLGERFHVLGDALEKNVDMERLLSLFDDGNSETSRCGTARTGGIARDTEQGAPEVTPEEVSEEAPGGVPPGTGKFSPCPPVVRIAVARDEAFCFLYPETLETLAAQGADLAFFSPLRDAALPEGCGGLYLPGGWPELYGQALSENHALRTAVAAAVRDRMPTVAEGGGFLYLGCVLRDGAGQDWPMAGALPGEAYPAGHLVRFGYGTMKAETDSLLFRAGERFPVHEFHHWDSTVAGDALAVEKPVTGRRWRCGHISDTLYAGFPHLCFAGNPRLAERFVAAARRYASQQPRR